MFTGIGTVNHTNIHPCIKYYHTNLIKLLYVYVIFKLIKFLLQNVMLTTLRNRLRSTILFNKICLKIMKGRRQNNVWLHHNIYNSIILEKEMTITMQLQMFIK